MIKTDTNYLKDTLTYLQCKYIMSTKYRLEDGSLVSVTNYVKSLISEGYKLVSGGKNSFKCQKDDHSVMLNASEAKLFFHISLGAQGLITACGYSSYRIT